jgi:uncharacterized protein YodC (DUF2158 family)
MAQQFQAGDTVQLKSGGPVMTVVEYGKYSVVEGYKGGGSTIRTTSKKTFSPKQSRKRSQKGQPFGSAPCGECSNRVVSPESHVRFPKDLTDQDRRAYYTLPDGRSSQIVFFIRKRLEAPPGFEPGMEVLQTSALPLGDGAGRKRSI